MFNWKNSKVLVTGSEGMIGKELVEQLRLLEANVYGFDIKNDSIQNAMESRCVELVLEKVKPDYVFHLIGVKGSPQMAKEYPIGFMIPMLLSDSNMIWKANEHNVKRFLYTSSIAVEFPEFDVYPSWAKLTGEKLIKAMRIQYPEGTKYCIVRPANVYGRYDDFTTPEKRAMVVTSLISKAIKEKKLEIWGDGSNVRDFINSKDVARGMIKTMEEMPDHPIKLCSGEGVKISELAEIITKHLNIPLTYIPLGNQVLGDKVRVMERNSDNPLLEDFKEGIIEVIDYVKNK